ncbi:MAG: phage capsid protein [Flavobacteriaceae bacterium]
MADTAFQKQYRQEFTAGFEFGQSMLRSTCTTEMVRQGNEAIFLVADTNGAEAVTRGVNGLIPARADNLTQLTATLTEWHDKPRRTRFNIFGSQGNGRKILQDGTVKVMNRKIDDTILTELNTATNDTGTATTASLALVAKAKAILGVNDVPTEEEDNMFGVLSPSAEAYLLQDDGYSSADYVDMKPLVGPARKMRRWAGINWMVHSRVPGVGTSAEKLFVYHRSAIGHAADTENVSAIPGYNEEEDYYWARTSLFMGSKLLQNSGVCVINHDGSAHAAS